MFKVIFQADETARVDSRIFTRLTEAMNFIADFVGHHGSPTTVNVFDDRGAVVFNHDELMRTCAQVRV